MENKKSNVAKSMRNVAYATKFLFSTNKSLFFVRIPILILQTASSLISIFFLRRVLNEITNGGKLIHVAVLAIFMALAILMISVINNLADIFNKKQQEKISLQIKKTLGLSIMNLPLSRIEDPRMKDFIELATTSNSFAVLVDQLSAFLSAIINLSVYASLILSVQPIIIVFLVAVVVIEIFCNRLHRVTDNKIRVEQAPIDRKMMYYFGLLSDARYGKELRVNRLKEFFLKKGMNEFENEYIPTLFKYGKIEHLSRFIIELAQHMQTFAIYIFLAVKVVFDGMLLGDFSMYLASSENLTGSIANLIESFSGLLSCGTFAGEFRYCMDMSKSEEIKERRDVFQINDFSIEFKNVSFAYPNHERNVLNNISFKLNSGERLSLVGVNGSGKSTLVKLICGFYEPTEGDIYIGGINSKELPRSTYAHMLSVVFQDFKLFSFSIGENVTMGEEEKKEKVDYCIEESGLKEKLSSLKDGIDTYIYKDFSETGIELSGGEAQKLAIARALYKDTPIILLDEPTGSAELVRQTS